MRFFLVVFVLLFSFFSCKSDHQKQIDVSDINVQFSIKRFDVDFYNTTKATLPKLKNKYPAKKPCNIHFIKDSGEIEKFSLIAKIESHIRRNIFFGGRAKVEVDAHKELEAKACEIGADAIFIDDSIETKVLEFSHIHVWARAFKVVDIRPE